MIWFALGLIGCIFIITVAYLDRRIDELYKLMYIEICKKKKDKANKRKRK